MDADAGTVAVIEVAEFTVYMAVAPLNFTAVAPVKLAPVIFTSVPAGPLVGLNVDTMGGTETVKLLAEVAVPFGVVTEICPVVAPAGIVVAIEVPELTVKLAAVPLKLTVEAPLKLVPVIVTAAPTCPLVGVKLLMVGVRTLTV